MDQHIQAVLEKRLQKTAAALCKNRFDAHVVRSREELPQLLRQLMPAGVSCSVGGSMTLFEAGIIDFLKSGEYRYLDRYGKNADTKQVFHDALNCDVYLTSANAITENGELYNMDGNGNRVAALIYGPEKVIVVAGYNKIVPSLEDARARVRKLAAPANAQRLNREELPCYHIGACMDCSSPGRFCSHEVICHFQMIPNRIAVLLVNEELGY